ncbi:hypothetical protein COV53_06020 [Candidatus Gottesmanbacteria bacterium CG11_big_fil_rev_8_21_14_0_20_37_11]|uniref:Uncharacterized protein n=3 Tax=Candidatus Gottesmaniibacteriota TaxID=1752720 RepID=A0A2M7RRV1_9BACT|nr:MAG: hypothetical protein AUJ73_02290 [Candidatus Gottesmanbacteria bacterium CG1_02_37_22]PIP32396.1 MAG: hypothetical protein COX23_04965 [Candidatus Gottesmanbacteria bacterium CG23_combo_of_CG06-09_8_20_14_all_37_19]PIR07857.1 MAG: hypothetical protein COV53_06020 [Candidatus Gottesmanbacteria bacterium CG11_big_fil_rev_8_21_14_0_20_37_11]PIZ03041.1 MAG: hypothetical protein COY59_01585 [Candidatus Gottesmanbacteria bacterium CG_4_10_14_0_8_um_filter_37_24]
MKNLNIIYLQIAGLNIKIYFTPPRKKTDDYFSYNKLRSTIIQYFGGFVLTKKPSTINYYIELAKRNLVVSRQIRENKISYSLDFYVEEPNKIVSYQYISLSQLLLLLKQVVNKFTVSYSLFLLHASASGYKGSSLIFTGKPNAGKSTMMSLIKDKYHPLADDSVIIKKNSNSYFMYQTPFIEKNDWVKKTSKVFRIYKIFFLRKSTRYKSTKIIDKSLILRMLMPQLIVTRNNYKISIRRLTEFVRNFDDFYYLYFAKDKNKTIELLDSSV